MVIEDLEQKVTRVFARIVPKTSKGSNFLQICSIFIVSLGGFSVGAHFAWTSPSIPQLILNSSYIGSITIEDASYISIISPSSMLAASFLIGIGMKYIGRKYIIGFMAIPHIISWILISKAKNIAGIYVARALSGISEAITFCTATVYIGEIATPSVRGRWGNMLTCAIYLGQLSIGSVGAYVGIPKTAYIFLFAPLLQILLIIFLPESPYFLLAKGKHDEAKGALRQLRWKTDVDREFLTLTADVERQISGSGSFKDLFCIDTNRKALLVLIGLRTCQQLSGMSAFIIYGQYIFQLTGAKFVSAQVSSIIFYSSLFLLSTISSFVISKYSRRTMLTISSFGCMLSLLFIAIYFYIMEVTEIDVSNFSWVPLFGMTSYIASLTAGLSLLPTLMTGELFSAGIKNHAMFVSSSYLALTVIALPKVLQMLFSNFSLHVTFLFFTFWCFVSTVFSYYCVPETKGKTLEEIQQLLSKRQ